jgi:hypothetical protein
MLTCEECGSHSVTMESTLRDDTDVLCAECGLYLGRYPEFFSRFVKAAEGSERNSEGAVLKEAELLSLP